MPDGPMQRYRGLIGEGEIRADPAQRSAVEKLQLLHMRLTDYDPGKGKRVSLGWFGFGRREETEKALTGLYLYGSVGTGKSMLMDLFFDCAPVAAKRRVHFHAFMREVHVGVHIARESNVDDPIQPVAEEIAEGAWLLCFDEFQVSDITDAMILGRLFERLFRFGVVVVATSNRHPDELYKDGLNRDLFVPFINLLKERVDILQLDAGTDYRQGREAGRQTLFTPLGREAEEGMDRAWAEETRGEDPGPVTLSIHGRRVQIAQATDGAGRASFDEICGAALGASDYLEIADRFEAFFLDCVPRLDRAEYDRAKRFVILIDALYEAKVRLYISTEAPPAELYQDGEGSFEFGRTASRLAEMQSADYVEAASGDGG